MSDDDDGLINLLNDWRCCFWYWHFMVDIF